MSNSHEDLMDCLLVWGFIRRGGQWNIELCNMYL